MMDGMFPATLTHGFEGGASNIRALDRALVGGVKALQKKEPKTKKVGSRP